MRIIFMGSPEFAVPSLDILVKNGYHIVAVITSSDSYGGRGGKQLIESAVKKYALLHHIPVLQPKNLKSPAFLEELAAFKANLQIVVAFRMLPEVVWNMPPQGTYNLHGSLLPKYRGAAPINRAVMNGETETGVTSFKLQHKIDTGDMMFQEKTPIHADEDAGSVHDRLMHLGAEVVLKTVQAVEKGKITLKPQSDEEATEAPKIFHDDCQLDFSKSTREVHNKIRGLSPYPGAWCKIDGKEFKILQAEMVVNQDDIPYGSIKCNHRSQLHIKCSDGYISVLKVKPEGKKAMLITEYLNGHKVESASVDVPVL
jgi:methionyl-tRNA formyltransferase